MTDPALVLSFRQSLRSCTACELSAKCNGPVPWSGDLNPRYAVLGEAPGRTEDAKGEPFVGDSGAILRHWLREVKIDPHKVTFLNSVSCYPNGTPSSVHMAACRPWVNGQLEFIRPEILISMGNVAFNQLRQANKPKLMNLHGRPLKHPLYGFWIWFTYHPAAYLRGKSKKYEKLITEDLAAVAAWDGRPLEHCYIRECDGELYRYDEWGVGLCRRHAQHQGQLFPDDVTGTLSPTSA